MARSAVYLGDYAFDLISYRRRGRVCARGVAGAAAGVEVPRWSFEKGSHVTQPPTETPPLLEGCTQRASHWVAPTPGDKAPQAVHGPVQHSVIEGGRESQGL